MRIGVHARIHTRNVCGWACISRQQTASPLEFQQGPSAADPSGTTNSSIPLVVCLCICIHAHPVFPPHLSTPPERTFACNPLLPWSRPVQQPMHLFLASVRSMVHAPRPRFARRITGARIRCTSCAATDGTVTFFAPLLAPIPQVLSQQPRVTAKTLLGTGVFHLFVPACLPACLIPSNGTCSTHHTAPGTLPTQMPLHALHPSPFFLLSASPPSAILPKLYQCIMCASRLVVSLSWQHPCGMLNTQCEHDVRKQAEKASQTADVRVRGLERLTKLACCVPQYLWCCISLLCRNAGNPEVVRLSAGKCRWWHVVHASSTAQEMVRPEVDCPLRGW